MLKLPREQTTIELARQIPRRQADHEQKLAEEWNDPGPRERGITFPKRPAGGAWAKVNMSSPLWTFTGTPCGH